MTRAVTLRTRCNLSSTYFRDPVSPVLEVRFALQNVRCACCTAAPCVQCGRQVTQCRCDPEVVSVHLFALSIMVFVLQLIVNTITVKICEGFFGFQVIQWNTRSG